MRNISELRFICSSFCKQYQSEAKFYVDEAHSSGVRHLVVVYEKGGYDGAKEFAVGIPKDWTDRDVIDLILWDQPYAQYPVWEVSARAYGSPMLDNSDRATPATAYTAHRARG
jgi:hypothetical protein